MEEQVNTAQKLINTLIEFLVNYSFQVFGAVVILIIGVILGKWVAKVVVSLCQRKKMDITLSKFLGTVAQMLVLVFAIIISLGKFGITIAPFVAALGAVAFGATYAIQGPLSNYGAGISIILGRPFVIGDTVTLVGVSGVVKDVQLGATTLEDEDGIRITIPNKHIVGEILQNSKSNKVAEGVVGVGYASDIDKAVSVISSTIQGFNEVTKTPLPLVGIQTFGDSAVNIGYRYWVPTLKFYQVSGAVNLAIFKALKNAKIDLPFPQREIRILSGQ